MRGRQMRPARAAAIGLMIGLMIPLVLSLGGCRTEDTPADNTPPDHIINLPKSQGKYLFGVADTLAVDFSEPIDTAALSVSFSDATGIGHAFAGAQRLLVFGTVFSHGQKHFPINMPFSLVLSGLKDLHGNGLPQITDNFTPYAWADHDFFQSDFAGIDSLYAADSVWIDGSRLSDSLVSEGSLDFLGLPGQLVDFTDYKIIPLAGADAADIDLTTRPDIQLSLKVFGPFLPDSLASAFQALQLDSSVVSETATQGKIHAHFVADLAAHKRKLGSFDATGTYLLRIAIPQDKAGFYRLGVRIRKFQ